MLRRNLIANYLGQGWAALMGLAFVPLYIKYMGIESYGLIGIFALLQAWFGLFDMGMTPTLSREMARFTAGTHSALSIRDLLRSVEVVAAGAALIIATGIWAASGWLANDWLRAEKLSVHTVAQAFAVMGVVTALRFLEGIFRSCIVGLQRQVLLNIVNGTMATIRSLGAVAIVLWISPTIRAFFIWQGAISLLTLAILALATYGALPSAERGGRFSLDTLRGIGRYAGGMISITLLVLLLTQVDKILLSKFLRLSEYGYYTLAAVVAGGLNVLVAPVTQAWFPRLSALHGMNDSSNLTKIFHQGAQLVSVVMGSAAVVVIIFSEPVLLLWTRDANLARHTAMLVSLLALGNLLNGLMAIPYQTQLAYGWTSLAVITNVVSVVFIVPALFWVTPRYGSVGAACVWVSLNAGYVLISIHFMFRRILIAEKWCWYRQDVLQPLLSSAAVALLLRWALPPAVSVFGQVVSLAIASAASITAAAMAAPFVRHQVGATVGSAITSFHIQAAERRP